MTCQTDQHTWTSPMGAGAGGWSAQPHGICLAASTYLFIVDFRQEQGLSVCCRIILCFGLPPGISLPKLRCRTRVFKGSADCLALQRRISKPRRHPQLGNRGARTSAGTAFEQEAWCAQSFRVERGEKITLLLISKAEGSSDRFCRRERQHQW